jgi:hypothetical protein
MKRQDRFPEQTNKVGTGNRCALEKVTIAGSIASYKVNVCEETYDEKIK